MEHFLARNGDVTFIPGLRWEAGVGFASEETARPVAEEFNLRPLHVRLEAGQLLYCLFTVRPGPGEAGLAILMSSRGQLEVGRQTISPPASIINVWISVTFSTKISRQVTVS